MITALVCASHSPLMYCFETPPADWEQIQAGFDKARRFVEDFDPELVFVFGSDHFNGFFLEMMPAFCVALSAEATSDIGGFSGKVNVPADTALQAIEHLRENGFDPAVSYQMTMDHGFSQTMKLILGSLDGVPTIPVFINCITKPFVPFARTRLFGQQLGRFAAQLDKKVLFLASGGMSHHPTRYYPAYGEGDEGVTAWQLCGGKSGNQMSPDQWLERLDVMHHEGAAMISRGERTAKDMRINEQRDRNFLKHLQKRDLKVAESWNQDQLVEEAGIGSMELQSWIAAAEAHFECGGEGPQLDVYSIAPEIGIGCGIVHG